MWDASCELKLLVKLLKCDNKAKGFEDRKAESPDFLVVHQGHVRYDWLLQIWKNSVNFEKWLTERGKHGIRGKSSLSKTGDK